MEIELEIEEENSSILYDILNPDNDQNIDMTVNKKKLNIKIKNLELKSIYSLPDDFLRNYEVFYKIYYNLKI
ncbi:hypothetical protein SE19_01225 [Acidiplasma aeolicum]|uniref:Uncharacterized protein n=1 Tax=Acidiplasma aeolicum TaxID=507754 RepID=A0A0Q0WEI2_9ARCH|nr:KEOPS complex subunit Pcc1 [Acidiplasma aeolicum]KPV47397.1 hypothetical protein SE19_01225 [Acidiplasma aeolicum]KQB33785.1 hypothetical protein AOG54_06490 [Acidiplasma aeolicum]